MGIRLGAVLLLIACGGKSQVTEPRPDLDNMKMYEPFGMKSEAKLPDHAVILGTDVKGGSTVLKIPAASASATIDALAVRDGAATQVSVKVTTAPNNDGTVRVGIFEDKVNDGGSQWRAGVWVAAIVAAHTLGKDLTDFTFSASASGYIDGPSASGLIAGGFLATMTGAQIDPAVTVSGVVNPDGTIGPVEGLPEKVKAAIAKGKTTIGYPSGMRRVRVNATTTVDLALLASTSGAVAVEVANVHDVYKLLTGKALPETIPFNASEMAVEATTSAALDVKYKLWETKVAAMSATLAEIQKSRVPAALTTLAALAKGAADRAAALHGQGAIGAAFARMLGAWVYATAATDSYAVLVKVKAGDRSPLGVGQLDPSSALQQIAVISPTTIGGHLLMMGAFQSALRGSGFAALAVWRVDAANEFLDKLAGKSKAELASPAVADELVAAVVPAELMTARSALDTAVAVQRLEFESAKSIGYMCSIPNVIRLATSYRSASTAGMSYLDSLLVEPLAKSAGITPDEARMRVTTTEPDYIVAMALANLDNSGSQIKAVLGETSLAWNLMLLAGAERAYIDAAQLTTKYYSFAEGLLHDDAFPSLLANAERAARTSARAAHVATGAIPIQAKLAYQLAMAQREGDRAEKLDALAGFWSATAYSQAAVMLARN